MTNKRTTRRDDDNKPKKRGAGSSEQRAGSREERAGSRERGAGSRERGAGSREQRADSRGRGAGSRERGAGSRERGAGSREQRVGSDERGPRKFDRTSDRNERNTRDSFDKPKRRERGDPSWKELSERGAKSRERRAGGDERGVDSRERRAGGREERAGSRERGARSNERSNDRSPRSNDRSARSNDRSARSNERSNDRATGRKEYPSRSKTASTKSSPFDKFDIDKMREAKAASLEKKERRRPSGREERAGSRERRADSRERGAGSRERGTGGREQRVESRERVVRKEESAVEPKKPLDVSKGFDRKKPSDNEEVRLNRFIANSGVCSRRKADELIEKGQITVNGEVVKELGYKVKYSDKVKFEGKLLKPGKLVYVLLNKPKDFITTLDDPLERRTVVELTSKLTSERIFPVGRLDRNTTGLLLLTNDGDLADKLSHPRNMVKKIYEVELDKSLNSKDFEQIREGVDLEDGPAKVDQISYLDGKSKKFVGVEIHIGRNRIVRRIFESLGYEVVKLDRVVYAGLTKKDLPRGRSRMLTKEELIYLKHLNKY